MSGIFIILTSGTTGQTFDKNLLLTYSTLPLII